MNRKLLFVLIFFSLIFIIRADVHIDGYVQNWFSVSTDNSYQNNDSIYGFSNRRIRFIPHGQFGKNFEWGVQLSFDKFSLDVLEAYIKYSVTDSINFRIGKWSAPGAASGSLTLSDKLDFVERAPITRLWGLRNNLSDFRAIGIEMNGTIMNRKIFYAIMIANAVTDGNNWLPSIRYKTTTNPHNGLAFWGRLEAYPFEGLKIGGFYGSGTEHDSEGNSIKRGSSGAHIYYKKNSINIKVEYISGEITGVKYNGMYALCGYRFGKLEPLVRYDNYTPIEGKEKFVDYTLGLNFFPLTNIKLQANYIFRNESIISIANNIFYLNFQFSFNSKI